MKERILVLDDEPVVQRALRKVLQGQGYRVRTTGSPLEALRRLQAEPPELLLLDLRMPQMQGLEVLKRAKELSPQTEVIIITGYGSIPQAVQALRHGAYDFLEKPLSPQVLLAVVQRCLERRRLLSENVRLRAELATLYRMENIVGASKPMQRVFELLGRVAPLQSTVLITGASGTGKELLARAIHYNSPRRDGPFVVLDCGAIPEGLIEAELFGHVRGSFTGAVSTQEGLVATAQGGTLFLDEVGSLPPSTQGKLLRLLQERQYRPVGARRLLRADVRIVAATNQELSELVRQGRFREDLYWRLNVFPLHLPPLRERREDIPLLAEHFLRKYAQETGKAVQHLSAEAMRLLMEHHWPGNVRELENTIHRAVILARGRSIGPQDILLAPSEQACSPLPRSAQQLKGLKRQLRQRATEALERAFLLQALREHDWNITRAARAVGMQRSNFHSLMRRHGIKRPH